MNSTDRVQVILELLDGKSSSAELAQRHGIDEQELLAWRDTWLAGARAAARPRAPNRRLWVLGAVVSAAVLGLASKEALAATCAAPASFSGLGLNYFCPNDPAVASEFNANTAVLVNMMQQKLGTNWVADAGASTVPINTNSLSLSGNLSFGSSVRQMISLWGPNDYGIGVQNSTLYFRTGASSNFAWYVGGTHANNAFDSGGGVEAMRLAADGTLGVQALSVKSVKQTDSLTLNSSPMKVGQLIVDATPSMVGTVVPIDPTALSALCRDDDGCSFTLGMVNWDNNGGITSRRGHLFMSQSNNEWRLDTDTQGTDGNGTSTDWGAWDCYFGDFNSATDSNNARADNAIGFGLLNARGGSYSDTVMTCRIVFRD